jgi:hypothetical protein
MKAYYGSLKYYHDKNHIAKKKFQDLRGLCSNTNVTNRDDYRVKSIKTLTPLDLYKENSLHLNNYKHTIIFNNSSFWPMPVKEILLPIYKPVAFNSHSLIYRN